jgi:hypothetical protein
MKKSALSNRAVRESKGVASQRGRRLAGVSKAVSRRSDGADAFLRVREGTASYTKDDLAEELAEGFVGSATSGEDQRPDSRDLVVDEELGGPFITTPARLEFAKGTDLSNPKDAEREPFPSVSSHGDDGLDSDSDV